MLYVTLLATALAGEDSPVQVTPFGWVRPGYTWIQDDDVVVTDQDGFVLQSRFGLEASFPRKVSARVDVDLTPEPTLKDATASWTPNACFKLDAGQFKVPISIGHLAPDSRRVFPILPLLVQQVSGRDLGVAATGSLPLAGRTRAAFTSAVMNGEGSNKVQNVNQRYLYAQRLLITPFGTRPITEGAGGELYLGFGGSWVYNLQGEGTTAEEINWVGGDLQLAWKGVSAQGEFLRGDHRFANATVQDYAVSGFYGQLGSFVPAPWAREHLEVLVRVGQHDANTEVSSDATLQFAPATTELSGGVNLYARALPAAIQDLKLQVAYTRYDETEGAEIANDQIQAQATIRF